MNEKELARLVEQIGKALRAGQVPPSFLNALQQAPTEYALWADKE